jgi:hypothetical protein
MDRGPISNLDAPAAAVDVEDSPRVIEKLRAHRIRFTVTVNPTPAEGEALCDIFWFDPKADLLEIQKLIYEAQKERA